MLRSFSFLHFIIWSNRLGCISCFWWFRTKSNVCLKASLRFQSCKDWVIHFTIFTYIISDCVWSIIILNLILVILCGVTDSCLLLGDVWLCLGLGLLFCFHLYWVGLCYLLSSFGRCSMCFRGRRLINDILGVLAWTRHLILVLVANKSALCWSKDTTFRSYLVLHFWSDGSCLILSWAWSEHFEVMISESLFCWGKARVDGWVWLLVVINQVINRVSSWADSLRLICICLMVPKTFYRWSKELKSLGYFSCFERSLVLRIIICSWSWLGIIVIIIFKYIDFVLYPSRVWSSSCIGTSNALALNYCIWWFYIFGRCAQRFISCIHTAHRITLYFRWEHALWFLIFHG